MLMTGTKDLAPIGNVDMQSRLAVYPALQGAPKYELVLHNAEHSVFIEGPLPGDHEPRNPNHHRVILSLSTAFWDAYLRGDSAALAWLAGSNVACMQPPSKRPKMTIEPALTAMTNPFTGARKQRLIPGGYEITEIPPTSSPNT